MATRQQITRLAQRIEALDESSGAPCLIVVDPSETKDQALARYMQQRGAQPRDPKPLAANRLHHLSSPVDIDAVEPPVAGIEQQGRAQSRVLAADDAGDILDRLVIDKISAPYVVPETSCVGQ